MGISVLSKTIAVVAFAAVAIGLSPVVHASILGDLVTGDGLNDVLEDNSRGLIVDRQAFGEEGFGDLSSGDIIYGLIRIDRRKSAPASPTLSDDEELVVIYSYMVDTIVETVVSPTLSVYAIDYKPVDPTVGTGLSIVEIVGDTYEPVLTDAEKAGLTFAVFENASATANPASDTVTPGATIVSSVAGDGSGYTLDMLGGIFSGADFFDNFVTTSSGGISIATDIVAKTQADTFGTASGGFSVIYDVVNAILLPVSVTSVTTGLSTPHDATISGGLLFGSDNDNWDFHDKADFTINAVPEPTSMFAWSMLIAAFSCCRLSRRR